MTMLLPIRILILSMLSVPALTDRQLQQIETASDRSVVLDEAAWYPLLANAMQWAGDVRAGSATPDYQDIMAHPAAHRGRHYLLRGRLARAHRVEGLARPGPWDGRLAQWAVLIRPKDNTTGEDTVALAYLVNPPPGVGLDVQVELAARFYKVWLTVDLENRRTPFPVFVGNTAVVVLPELQAKSVWPYMTLTLVLMLGLGWLVLRRVVGKSVPRPLTGRRHRTAIDEADDPSTLSTDPAEALDQLRQRQL